MMTTYRPVAGRMLAFATSVSALALITGQGAFAQENAEAAPRGGIETITVTAERRETTAQSTPLALTAMSEAEIRDARIEDISDLVIRIPNFSFTPFAVTDPQLFIRGIGSTQDGAGGDPSIVVLQDDVVFGRFTGQATPLFDLQRIEVLRGPQGTLFGRNAAGGVVHYVTNRPSDRHEGMVSITPVGDHDRFETEFMANVPINEDWAFRIAGRTSRHDGYNFSTTTGRDVDDGDTVAGRVHLQYEPSSEITALLTANYSADRIYGDTRTPLPRGTFVNRPGVNLDPDPRIRQPNFDGYLDRDILGLSLNIDAATALGDFTSVTAYRNVSFSWLQDLGGIQVPPFILRTTNLQDETSSQVSQEFRLANDAMGGRLHWVGGVFFSNEEIDRDETFDRQFAGTPSNPSFIQDLTSRSVAVFGSLTYDLTDRVSLTAGLRQSWDEKEGRFTVIDNLNGTSGSLAPALEEYDTPVGESWSALTPRFTVDFQATDDLMLYATIARGYKAGGFDSAPASASAARVPFDPEYVWNYEAGLRWDFWDDRARFNATAFTMSYTDLQVQQLIQLVPGDPSTQLLVIDNAADATVEGLEFEFMVAPTDALRLGGTVSYLNATFDEFITSTNADLSGNHLRRAPENSYSIYGSYTADVPAIAGSLEGRVEYAYRGDQFFENENFPVHLEESYGLLDASLTYLSDSGDWRVSLWGKNLTDELYRVNAVSVSDSAFAKLGPPLTWGITFRRSFGG